MGIQLILIERGGEPSDERYELPRPDAVLHPDDRIVVFGKQESVSTLLAR
jgi:Trk K+ transport system NAD-binding subunit